MTIEEITQALTKVLGCKIGEVAPMNNGYRFFAMSEYKIDIPCSIKVEIMNAFYVFECLEMLCFINENELSKIK